MKTIPESVRRRLIAIHGEVCWYCGIPLREFRPTQSMGNFGNTQLDHIIPRSFGGTNDIDNLAVVCGFCNRAKSSWCLEEFFRWQEHIRSFSFRRHIEVNGIHPTSNLALGRIV